MKKIILLGIAYLIYKDHISKNKKLIENQDYKKETKDITAGVRG